MANEDKEKEKDKKKDKYKGKKSQLDALEGSSERQHYLDFILKVKEDKPMVEAISQTKKIGKRTK